MSPSAAFSTSDTRCHAVRAHTRRQPARCPPPASCHSKTRPTQHGPSATYTSHCARLNHERVHRSSITPMAAAAAAAAEAPEAAADGGRELLHWWPSHAAELQQLGQAVEQLLSQLDSLQPGEGRRAVYTHHTARHSTAQARHSSTAQHSRQ